MRALYAKPFAFITAGKHNNNVLLLRMGINRGLFPEYMHYIDLKTADETLLVEVFVSVWIYLAEF